MKMKEREKINKYLDLARKLQKLLNMNESVIPIAVSAFEKVWKKDRIELEIRGRLENVQTTALIEYSE